MQFAHATTFPDPAARGAAGAGAPGGVRADALDGLLEVRSAYVNVDDGVFQLFARVAYPVNDDIRAALKDGLTLTFDLDVGVARERRFWFDADVVEYTLRRELAYHAVSDRYVTRDVDPRNGEQHSYATLEEALEALGTVDAWPILRRAAARRRTASIASACAPACAAAACPTRCACCCSGPTTGIARASGSHGPCRAEDAAAPSDSSPCGCW